MRTSAKEQETEEEEEEEEPETKDLFVLVDNPEKHATTMESYITFRVTTKVCKKMLGLEFEFDFDVLGHSWLKLNS